MKNVFLLVFLFLTTQLFAQVPINYYDRATGLTGDSLRTALYNTIKDHQTFPYTSTATDTWDILKEADRNPENSDSVVLIYTGRSAHADEEYNSGNGWSREHVWAKSHGDFGTERGAGTDAHHLRPVHQPTNSARNNRWFADCDIPYDTLGNFKCDDIWGWEPRDAVKGDVARMIFYMDLRYEGENGEPDLQVIDTIPEDNNTREPIHAKLSSLMAWHLNDPVDDWERKRNDVIYTYQGNRNPFIDRPNYACQLWPEVCTKLPIELSSFEVAAGTDRVFIDWTTVSETGTSHFDIERSTDGSMWRSIHIEDAAGNSQTQLNYSHIDLSPLIGNNYYRIKTVDENGLFCYSEVRLVKMTKVAGEVTVIPNPNNGEFILQLEVAEFYPIIVEVFDPIGRLLHEDAFLAGNGLVQQPVNIRNLSPGFYFVRVRVAEQVLVTTMVKN